MLDDIRINLNELCKINPRQPILVGVSGGPDSIALLHILHQFGFPLIVAHFNHMIRTEADQEAEGVKQITFGLKLSYLMGKEDVRGFAEQNSISMEEAARQLRYKFLFEKANEMGVQAVAVGHTADDQVETVLMHFIRGSGLEGLAGMCFRMLPNAWSETIPLIRPLLSTWRKEILRYVDDQHLQVFYDRSNQDSTYFRNRIRHELIPLLETYNPQIKKIIWRTAQALRADNDELSTMVESEWQKCFIDAGSGYVQFDSQKLDKLSLSLKRSLIRKGFNILRPGLQDLDFDAVNRAIVCLARQTISGGCDLISGIRFQVEGQSCWLVAADVKFPLHKWPQFTSGNLSILTIPGEKYFNDTWIIRGDIFDRTSITLAEAQQNPDPYQAWIDFDQVILPIKIRTRNSDDRFQPLGILNKTVKLSDFMTNVKIPQRARNKWPLLCDRNGMIIWVPGFRITHPCRITDQTTRILHLQMQEVDRN
jgi:tRNA(Ile)-lysidine synthase